MRTRPFTDVGFDGSSHPNFLVVAASALFFAVITHRINTQLLLFQGLFLTSFLHSREILATTLTAIECHRFPSLTDGVVLPTVVPGVELYTLRDALGATWSLSIEEWFYILWAPIVLTFGRLGIALAGVPFLIVGFLLRWANGPSGFLWYQDFFCRFDLLIIGAGLAWWLSHRRIIALPKQALFDRAMKGIGSLSFLSVCTLLICHRPFVGKKFAPCPHLRLWGPSSSALSPQR
jgi:peptidoglycan/LPS O-acetylase OafA/YrhL